MIQEYINLFHLKNICSVETTSLSENWGHTFGIPIIVFIISVEFNLYVSFQVVQFSDIFRFVD